MSLTEPQIERYGRQILLDEIGGAGQAALLGARVGVVGAGGLGSPVVLYLAAAGVGHLTVIDPDTVALSNLHRQILHGTADLGRPKARRAAEAVAALNPEVRVDAVEGRLEADNADAFFRDHDLVVDGSDTFDTRFLANDAAVRTATPLVHGAVLGFSGQVMVVAPGAGGCYRCLFEAPPPPGEVPACSEAGVVGAACGVLGSVMALEAIKRLVGVPGLEGRMWTWDGITGRVRTVTVPRNPRCPACGAAAEARP